jgi:hypothetical protein
MRPDARTVKIRLPPISDEAVVQIHDFLYDFVDRFEAHYAAQIRRFYDDRSWHNLARPDPLRYPSDDDPPF